MAGYDDAWLIVIVNAEKHCSAMNFNHNKKIHKAIYKSEKKSVTFHWN
jgi:hypothetical protein